MKPDHHRLPPQPLRDDVAATCPRQVSSRASSRGIVSESFKGTNTRALCRYCGQVLNSGQGSLPFYPFYHIIDNTTHSLHLVSIRPKNKGSKEVSHGRGKTHLKLHLEELEAVDAVIRHAFNQQPQALRQAASISWMAIPLGDRARQGNAGCTGPSRPNVSRIHASAWTRVYRRDIWLSGPYSNPKCSWSVRGLTQVPRATRPCRKVFRTCVRAQGRQLPTHLIQELLRFRSN